METTYSEPICRIIKKISSKDFPCTKEIQLNIYERCPFKNCIEDLLEDKGISYSNGVIKLLSDAIRKWERWQKKKKSVK